MAAARTTPNNTPESLIVGVGASGALLAGAAIVFITLVGLVSFNVWPSSRDGVSIPNIELQAATNGAHHQAVASTSTGAAQPATVAPSITAALKSLDIPMLKPVTPWRRPSSASNAK